ncbi:craniofacial development protein 2-like [Ostrea edulis]|uniref:craniofacial development protein 2-like n=1 Tax=Ostrea edulis TaxID=37623 RepID=UPI0024AFE712|nr:craniofacial development protein 2-like [Ostrea edulis]
MTRKPRKLFSPKHSAKIACWNIRTLYQSGKCVQVAKEMDRYNIEILGLSEVRLNTSGITTISTGHTIVYSGNLNINDPHEKGVGFLLNKTSKKALLEWNPVSQRIITARFDTKFQKTTIIQVYAPTNEAEESEKDDFYNALQATVDKTPKRDILIIMGDLNAKVGSDGVGRETEIGPHGIGNMNENGELFADFCAVNKLMIGGTFFPHKTCHKITWASPAGNAENQIDHIAISHRWRSSLQDVRNKRGADAASDHHLLMATIKLKLLSKKKQNQRGKSLMLQN